MSSFIGGWSFVVGFILALVLGAIGKVTPIMAGVLVILGVLIGLLNISDKEIKPFLMSGAVLVIVASLGKDVMKVIPLLANILDSMMLLFVPATMIVALTNLFHMSKN